jgi:hypothetical protein
MLQKIGREVARGLGSSLDSGQQGKQRVPLGSYRPYMCHFIMPEGLASNLLAKEQSIRYRRRQDPGSLRRLALMSTVAGTRISNSRKLVMEDRL